MPKNKKSASPVINWTYTFLLLIDPSILSKTKKIFKQKKTKIFSIFLFNKYFTQKRLTRENRMKKYTLFILCVTIYNMKIIYNLTKADDDDFDFVKRAKTITIFDYAKNISYEEKEQILSYVDRFTNKFLKDYRIIKNQNEKMGVFLVRDYEDGVLLDEIFLLPQYRNLGIGSDIIKNELEKHNKVYLYVYKENEKAVNLYKRLGFHIFEDKNERYLMLFLK